MASGQQEISWGRRISQVVWDRDDKSEEERKYVQRLDLGLMTIACLGYFIKYLDQANVQNAYVSGMKEDLNIQGDEYNTLLTMFTVGYVVGQYPGTLLMVKVSPSIWLPCCEMIWTSLVIACAAAKNVRTLYILRFFIGLCEASAYPGMLWVLGSWYMPSELGKRMVIFISCSAVGTMISGYLQAGVYNGLNGVNGYSGWQWLFFVDGMISFPIALAGFFMIPDTPHKLNPRSKLWFRESDLDIALSRAERFQREPPKGFSVKGMIQAFRCWVPWFFVVPYTCDVVGLGSYTYMNLWLKSTGKYTVSQINTIPTGGYALQIVFGLVYSWASDILQTRWPIIAFAALLPLTGNIILASWPASDTAKFVGFYLNFTITGTGALTFAWINELMSSNAENRAIVIGFINTMSYVINAWAPNVIFPASKAPNYPAGYKVTSVFFAVYLLGTVFNAYYASRHPVDVPSGSKVVDEESVESVDKKKEPQISIS
ncbi:hypothetical protein D9758_007078 [Tetrapyrgos nigripes]|uniref:Major facilitator superfamily (MFS) profile domain-containing protein n=1 Tax=Tetrapyrgos nigripes TaxID=182062 RepID=A0A8H5LMT2_9AGAR|nr:hypothetical protein D9758_007078 [Tetrapyrgos nigripes]